MKNSNKKQETKQGNLTKINPSDHIEPLNQNYSVTRHDLPAKDETNIPLPDEKNTIQSKKFVDQNHL